MKKAMALILNIILTMSITFFGNACSSASEKSTISDESTIVNEVVKNYKISWATMVYTAYDKNNLAIKTLKEAFPDIDFDLIAIENSVYNEQINTCVAAGDIPDIIHRGSRNDVINFAAQGILAELPQSLFEKNAPVYYKAIMDFDPAVFLACSYNGNNYGLPATSSNNSHIICGAWRNDWLKNVGINKVPETLVEMEAAFVKFVNNDPDRNGKKDTYAMTAAGKDKGIYLQTFDPIWEAFGISGINHVMEPNGKLKMGATTERGKQAVTLLSKWYKMGLIDPEFPTDDQAIEKQKFINGKTGYIITIYPDFEKRTDPTQDGPIRKNTMAANPKADVVMGYAPKGPTGKFGYYSYGSISSSICFGKQLEVDQPKFARCLQVIERICATDLKLNLKLTRGIEGVNYKIDSNGKPQNIPPFDDSTKTGPLGTAFFSSLITTPKFQQFYRPVEYSEDIKYSSARSTLDGKDYFSWIDLFQGDGVWNKVEGYYSKAGKTVMDFITGARPMTDWNKYVDEWNKTGGAIVDADYANAYKTGLENMKAFQKK